MRFIKSGALLLLMLPGCAWSQQELTLDEAISTALQHNRLIKVSELEINRAGHNLQVMRLYRLPALNTYAVQGHLLTPLTFVVPPGTLGTYPGFGPLPASSQPITTDPRFFTLLTAQVALPVSLQYKIHLGIENELLNGQIAKEKLSLQEQTIVDDVKKTYYNLVEAQSALRATEETVKLLKELERMATNGLEEQVVLKSDLLDAQQGVASAESQTVTLRNTADTLKEKLNSLLARDLTTDFSVTPTPEIRPWEMDLPSTRARALAQRPELREARLKIQQADIDRRVKKAEYIPEVALHMDYISFFNLQFLPKNVLTLGFEIKYEVFDWGRKKQELAAKINVIDEAKLAVDETTSQIQVEVGLYFRKLAEARQQLRVANLALEADQEKVRVAMNKYEQKAALLKDVLQLQAAMAEKTYKYQETLMSFWTARADLEKAIGER